MLYVDAKTNERCYENHVFQVDGQVTAGLTPLHYACFINYLAAAKLLLNLGAKVSETSTNNYIIHKCNESFFGFISDKLSKDRQKSDGVFRKQAPSHGQN